MKLRSQKMWVVELENCNGFVDGTNAINERDAMKNAQDGSPCSNCGESKADCECVRTVCRVCKKLGDTHLHICSKCFEEEQPNQAIIDAEKKVMEVVGKISAIAQSMIEHKVRDSVAMWVEIGFLTSRYGALLALKSSQKKGDA